MASALSRVEGRSELSRGAMSTKRRRLLLGTCLVATLDTSAGFTSSSFMGRQQHSQQQQQQQQPYHSSSSSSSSSYSSFSSPPPRRRPRRTATTLMVFDFFKNRATEGIAQLENIATKTSQGKLGEALADTSAYVTETNEKFYDGLAKSRDQLLSNLDGLFGGDMKLEETLEQLEEVLMMADIGGTTTDEIIADLRIIAKEDSLDPDDIKSVLRGRLVRTLEGGGSAFDGTSLLASPTAAADDDDDDDDDDSTKSADDVAASDDSSSSSSSSSDNPRAIRFAGPEEDPQLTVLMVIGANGMGKTTTIGKLANRLREEAGQKVMLAACDTFRAAAVDQLETWADRAQVGFLGPEGDRAAGVGGGSDEKPATVLYRALDQAIADEVDVLIVDTSGRLSNNVQLNEELKKMKRVVEKKIGRPPHEVLLVVDASIGRNAVDQARTWRDDVGVSGVVVTKLDGTARAGYVVAMTRDLGLPVKLIGVGEKIDDLRDFEPESFVDALLGNDEESSKALQQRLDANLASVRSRQAEAEKAKKKQQDEVNKKGAGGLFGGLGGGGGGGGGSAMVDAPPSTAAEPLELVMIGDDADAEGAGFSSGGSRKKGAAAKKSNKKKKKKKKN